MVKIYVDAREIPSGIPDALRGLGAEVETGNLETGDYVVRNDIVVERKSAIDFVQSIFDQRFLNQAAKMKLSFKTVIFLVEGDIYATRSKIKPEALDGAISYLVVIMGCTVLYYKSAGRAAGIIYRFGVHAQEGLGYDVAFRKGKVAPGKAQALFTIEGLTGAGPVTSKKLLNQFRSVFKVINASEAELKQVNGIGTTKAQRMYEGIHWEMPDGEDADSEISLFADQPATQRLV